MKNYSMTLALVAALALVGCGAGKSDYVLKLTGYGPHAGSIVRMKLKAGDKVSDAVSATVAQDGTATLKVEEATETGVNYNVDWFVDNNDNGACDSCGTASGEHAWRKTHLGGIGEHTDTHSHDTDFTDIAPF
jgi:hypothetical protein